MSSSPNPLWSDPEVVEGYRYIERITGSVGKLLIKQSSIFSSKETPLVVLDNACGTGVISAALYDELDDAKKANLQLTCGGITSGMVEHMKHMIASRKWTGASAKPVDAQATGLPSDYSTHVFTNFGFQTISKTILAVDGESVAFLLDRELLLTKYASECFRMLRPNGVFASTTWEHCGWIEVITEAAATVPNAPTFPEWAAIMNQMSDGEWNNCSWLKDTLVNPGFADVKIDAQSLPWRWENLQYLMDTTFPKIMCMAPTKLWSKGNQEKFCHLLLPALKHY